MSRRRFLQATTRAALGTTIGLLPIGPTTWAAASAERQTAAERLVVVLLRGAVDGLNVVVPYADPGYAAARASIAIGRPGDDGGALDLDGRFGLHPALAPLMPLWQSGTVGFVQACGSPDPTRSHFDAQDYMESATPGVKSTPDGWMNRLCGELSSRGVADAGSEAPTTARAVSVGPVLPRIYAGSNPVASIANGAGATRPTLLDRTEVIDAFGALYGGDDKLARAFQQSIQARHEVRSALSARPDETMAREQQAADNGAPLPTGFPQDAARLARLMRNDHRVQLAVVALGGWDTHANQGAAKGQLASRLAPLGAGLAALASGLGPVFDDTVVVVMSEFGRTVRENGNGGTDHGHANVMWLLGGRIAGGKVHGEWPGLDASALHEGRDLALTTDFRAPLAQIAERHLRLSDARLATLFPGYRRPGNTVEVMRT